MRFLLTTSLFLALITPFQIRAAQELLIVSPAPGEVIAGDAVWFEARLPQEIRLVDPDEHPIHADDKAHLHVWLDALPAHDDATSVVLTDEPTHTYANVFSGLHTIYVELYRNDHARFDPPVYGSVEFETFTEILTPQNGEEPPPVAPPISSGGFFLPPGGGNTLLTLVVVVILVAVLWYFFGRRHTRPK